MPKDRCSDCNVKEMPLKKDRGHKLIAEVMESPGRNTNAPEPSVIISDLAGFVEKIVSV